MLKLITASLIFAGTSHAFAEGEDIQYAMEPYRMALADCAAEHFKGFYEVVFEQPMGDREFSLNASLQSQDRALDYRNGKISFEGYWNKETSDGPVTELSLSFSNDNEYALSGYISVPEAEIWFTAPKTVAVPTVSYRAKVTGYRVDRFGQIKDVTQELDGVRLSSLDASSDMVDLKNQYTGLPLGFKLPGLYRYRQCIYDRIHLLPEFEE